MNFLNAMLSLLGFVAITFIHTNPDIIGYSLDSEMGSFISCAFEKFNLNIRKSTRNANKLELDPILSEENSKYEYSNNIAEELRLLIIRTIYKIKKKCNAYLDSSLENDENHYSYIMLTFLLLFIVAILKFSRIFHSNAIKFKNFNFSRRNTWHRVDDDFHYRTPMCSNKDAIMCAFPTSRRDSIKTVCDSVGGVSETVDSSKIPKRRLRRDSFFQ
eukprot:NODE_29_length_33183_cov_0.333666.p14 type:complete len:216 gc:universal NODE_29_length_33183_cov_0.333666:19838-19191(-)